MTFFGGFKKRPETPKFIVRKIVIDEQLINAYGSQGPIDVQKVIEPLWWSVSIYDSEEKYINDLAPFTTPQRYVFAIQWYSAEVNNGGHVQFYDNSTGIVWEDALKGFEAIGAFRNVEIIKESANRIGGRPSKNREERQRQLDSCDSDLFDLDMQYYEAEDEMTMLLYAYIRKNINDFLFLGEISVPNISDWRGN